MWLVGAGYWGQKIVSGLRRFDIVPKVIDIRNGDTIDKISNKEPVILATPLWNHYEQAKYILNNGNDLYVEKPLAETESEVDDINSHIRNDQVLMIGHIFVTHPQLEIIKKRISDGEIGKILHISSARTNWGIFQTKTDPVLSLATHDISIINELTNDSIDVASVESWQLYNKTQKDRVWFSGSSSDISFDIDVSWCSPIRNRKTIIIGETGQIIWDQDKNTIFIENNIIKNNKAIKDNAPEVSNYNFSYSPLEYELKHFIDCVNDRKTPIPDISQAKEVASVIDQVKNYL